MSAELNTVHAGFIKGVFDESDELRELLFVDKPLNVKYQVLIRALCEANYGFLDKVSLEIHSLFQEILNDAEEKFGIKLPRAPEEFAKGQPA